MSISAIQPIPLDLRKDLSDYHIPWSISKRIFNEMKSQNSTSSYKKVQVLPMDPEWRFVWRYFHHDKPNHYGIKKIYCIHERHQQQAFEFNISSIEREAIKFKPTWDQEPRALQRAKAIERWKQGADVFSPFSTMEADGRRKTWKEVKILPLWHGSSEEVCESIATLGFVHFGKISLGGSAPKSTDEGFFGSGIYFTNSARYASDIYSRGYVFLAWVSMREPFPFVGDPCQIDMKAMKGKGAYKDYNAHYIPVTSINSSDTYESIYYPTKEEETTHCDEFVVFQKVQALPRFLVELEVELPYAPSNTPQFVNELIPHFMKLLQNPNVDRDQKLRNYLCRELEILLTLEDDDELEERHEMIYNQLKQILDPQQKVNRDTKNDLIRIPQSANPQSPIPALSSDALIEQSPNTWSSPQSPAHAVSTSTIPQPVTSELRFESLLSKQEELRKKNAHKNEIHIKKHNEKADDPHKLNLSPKPTFPNDNSFSTSAITFGKADWEKYFGYIGLEPPLPANIEEILNAPCSFWPNKKVRETHLLVLIPNKVNGKHFTLNSLEMLIQNPKSGHATNYKYYDSDIKKKLGKKSYPSHWILITKDVVPGSRGKEYSEHYYLFANHSKKICISYELPYGLEAASSILMHYVKTGERLYTDGGLGKELTFTRCQERINSKTWSLVVGGFASDGLEVSYCFCSSGKGRINDGVAGVRKL